MSEAHAGSPKLIPGGAPLESVAGLRAAQIASLHALWIYTAQQLVGIYGANGPTRARLAALLQAQPTALDLIVNGAQRLIPPHRGVAGSDFAFEVASHDYPLGALLEDPAVTAAHMAELPPYCGAIRGPLPTSHSLLHQLPPLRSQGQRPTCVAHAALAVREQLEIAAGAPTDTDLSEQYVYWWCKERDGLPRANGTYLSLGMRCLKESGAPREAIWPYQAAVSAEEGSEPPPAHALNGDPCFATAETQEFRRSDIDGIKTCLVEGRAVAFSLPVYESWFKSSAMARWGLITMPLPGEPPRDGHAVAMVGYQDEPTAPGGGYFLLRNSWQPWAWESVWQPGYGYIPYAYVSRCASTIFSARRQIDARAYVRGEPAEGSPWLTVHSPDVWLRQAPDGGQTAQPAVAGQEHALYVRLHNPGPTNLHRVRGEIYFQRLLTPDWTPAGRFEAPLVPPGESLIEPVAWQPPLSGPFSFAVRLE